MNAAIMKKEKDTSLIIVNIIFIVSTILLVLKGAPYFYIITILAISSNYKEKAYIFTNIVALIISFITSINNGYEMVIVCSTFFLLKIISNFYIKNNVIKRMLPYVITNLVLFLIYFIPSISFVNFSSLFFSFSFSFLTFYAFHKILDNYQYSTINIDSKDRIIIYTIIPFLFEGIPYFYLFFIRLIHLFLIKTAKFSEALSSVILTSFFFAYFLNMSQIDILLFILPFLFSFLISKKYSLLIYGVFYILSSIFIMENFYISPSFYQGLMAIVISLFIPESLYLSINKLLLKDKEKENEEFENQKLENIISYLSIVLSSEDNNLKDPLEMVYEELKKDLCINCERKRDCKLNNIIKNGIKNKYEKEERKKVLDNCLYPYKLFKRTLVISEIYKKEEKKILENINTQNLYKKELENLYFPLKENKKELTLENLKKELLNDNVELIDIKKYGQLIEVEIFKYHQNDEEIILTTLEYYYNKSFSFIDKRYSFSLGGYILSFSSKNIYDVKISTFSKSVLKDISGDKIYYKKEDNNLMVLLSDGMGHNKKSETLSSYLIESLLAYKKIDKDYSRQLETINRLLYQKSNVEMYATLDYFILDLVNLNFTLFKAGSFPTFIFHNDKLKESKKNFTPLGILEKIEPFAYKDVLELNDIVVFMSDGFGSEVFNIIEKTIFENKEEDLDTITYKLKEDLELNNKVIDDKSLILIKIEKAA